MPLGHLRTRLVQDPSADLADLTGLFEDRNELVRCQQPICWVVPAQKSFNANDFQRVERINRLVHEAELLARQGRSQIEFKPDPPADIGLHLGVEELEAVLSLGLGLVERNIGITQQLAARSPITHGDPNTRVDMDRR
jgi:hypothetical protein